MPNWMRQRTEQLGGNNGARAKLGRTCGTRDSVAEHQFSIRPSVNQHGRYPHKRFSMLGDLPLKFDWIGPINSLERQPESRGIDVEKRSRTHPAIIAGSNFKRAVGRRCPSTYAMQSPPLLNDYSNPVRARLKKTIGILCENIHNLSLADYTLGFPGGSSG